MSVSDWIFLCNKWSSRASPAKSVQCVDLCGEGTLSSLTPSRISSDCYISLLILKCTKITDFFIHLWLTRRLRSNRQTAAAQGRKKITAIQSEKAPLCGRLWECLFPNCCRPQRLQVCFQLHIFGAWDLHMRLRVAFWRTRSL